MGFRVQLLDTDVAGLRASAQRLRRLLSVKGVEASVEEISCFLEITRQGYITNLPVVLLDGQCMCSRYVLSEELLESFSETLKNEQMFRVTSDSLPETS
jgi:hypothetical protein